ncbi:MAG TPA: mannose-1-phosphate guanylyltransferase/mannose-6-phosphate isomerase [Candidatus Competibacteraceae bacterium]|nr:mannose-1-phosphate guanylyltransferase/mannose-6-phosphate isomerase [Candidatus Competibacteraceae bacterium]HQA26731.1 mannose-1-phosphate guanylyltransferase/mannose-6-phosphate isomerase [Candidatus Competibacteraceae bacterium]HQD56939.1 mannose-1-phosphate guanylyltransferase/mannose-6-phosphate isomerase [Candidatus Competibacteraceae bacterium]
MIVPVILSGGSGTRLWPLSRETYPKQFLPLVDAQTLLQNTAVRIAGLTDVSAPLVICNADHRFMVAEQLRSVGIQPATVLLEPVGRNTAPAVAVAALHAQREGDDPILLVLPADHVISDVAGFRAAIHQVAPQAEAGRLITFGIVPTAPETGYGYIKAGAPLEESVESTVCAVERFVEKPDLATARGYLESGRYYWNSGMFMFRASTFLAELERFAPAMLTACRQALTASHLDTDFCWLERQAFAACPKDSIDYAVMEKTDRAVVMPLAVGWNDVGSWAALWDVTPHDTDGNILRGDVITVETHDTYVDAATRLVATVGVDHLVVVETPDAVLVAHKDRVQEVKEIVARLQASARPESRTHRKVYRPWGCYDAIDMEARFQVKRIMIRPGASISLQMHHHRAEHWVVVSGTARVARGDEVFLLTENQSTYIPVGVQHRLTNPGKIPLEIIEIQSGSYLAEDDIVRFEDIYGRGNGEE